MRSGRPDHMPRSPVAPLLGHVGFSFATVRRRMNMMDRARFGVLAAVAVASIPGPAGQATAAARNVCTGVAGCKGVAKVDVNGDGKTDQVGVVRSGTAEDGRVTVRVLTAG